MFKNDYLLDLSEALGKNIGKTIKNEKDDTETVSIENLSDKDMLLIILRKLLMEKRYNEAENTLFEYAERVQSSDILKIGQWFYKSLYLKSDSDLSENNFSRHEIQQGQKDFIRFFE